ncbi:flagellar hook-length control protein FliK [Marinomonas flavescens]|uniref:flagellar hook-length control protein FliK n=1 Tax=Marinomonas flavescens TaxID=2529379 RepID=UPI001054EA40|nr:flagellar hook-length control protein FliK [Marinomonas flavescens]
MQAVTNQVLSSPIPAKSSESRNSESESRGHFFAENLHKAKQSIDSGLNDSTVKNEAGVDSGEHSDSATEQSDDFARSENTKLASSEGSEKSDSKPFQPPPPSLKSAVETSSGNAINQDSSLDSGKILQRDGQKTSDTTPLKEANGNAIASTQDKKLTGSDLASKNIGREGVKPTLIASDADDASEGKREEKSLSTSSPSDLVKIPQLDSKAQTVAIDKEGRPVIAFEGDAKLTKGVNDIAKKATSKEGHPAVASEGDAKLAASEALSNHSKLVKHSLDQKEGAANADVAPVSVSDASVSGEDTSSIVAGKSTEADRSQLIKGESTEVTNNKVPAEVRALHSGAGKAGENKSAEAGLASIGSKAKILNQVAAKKVAGEAALGSDIDKKSKEKPLDAEGSPNAGDSTDLSWVLSQMGHSAAQTPAQTKSTVSSGIPHVLSSSGSKVSDQVALANAVKGSQPKEVSPLILGDGTSEKDAIVGGVTLGTGVDHLSSNEPVELRKKEQDALIGKMTAQLDGASKEADTGGLNSSISATNNLANRLSPAASQNTQTFSAQQNLAMSMPPNHPGWAGEMSQKVAWVAQSGIHTAHIKLDPPELGSLTVKVSVDSDNNNTQVSFMAATPHTRDLLENQMGRLRDMLAQQGMDLNSVDVGVSQQDTTGSQYQGAEQGQSNANPRGVVAQDTNEDALNSQNVSYVSPSGVDYYA